VLAATFFLPWALPELVILPSRLAVGLVAALSLAFARRAGARARAAALAASAAVVLAFFAVGRLARADLTRRLAAEPDTTLHDIALSPLPADPLCWTLIAVQTNAAGELVLRRATYAPFPSLYAAGLCPEQAERVTTPLAPVAAPGDASTRWEGEFRAPLARLRSLARERCDAAAMLRFVRTPFWAQTDEGTVLGDLRFDRNDRLGFAELRLAPPGAPCPPLLPPWLPPRSDLLAPAP